MNERQNLTGEGGHLSDEGVALFVDALKLKTVEQLPGAMREHVAGCDECQRNVTGLFAALRKEDYAGVKAHPYFQIGSVPQRGRVAWIWRAAAAVAVLVLLPALIYFVFVRPAGEGSQRAELTGVPAPGDTAAVAPPGIERRESPEQPALAANFSPNQEYEELVSAGTRAPSLKDVMPVNGAVLGGAGIRFQWTPGTTGGVHLVIMNSGGQEVYSARIATLPHEARKRLAPGLYYWKIVNEEEAVYFGKFTVREAVQSPRSTNPAQK